MPANAIIAVPASTWTLLTSANVTEMRLQNLSGNPVKLMGTVGVEEEPEDDAGHIRLGGGESIYSSITLAQLWPGVSGVNRVYAWCDHPARVSISHA